MNFNTKVDIAQSISKIDYHSSLMSFGSCFSENIGKMLENLYFNIDVNPFGTLYNPISIAHSIERLVSGRKFSEKDLFEHKSLYNSFLHDSSFSSDTAEKTLENINLRFEAAAKNLKNIDFLLITFGTAWYFTEKQSGNVVSNCHKLPSENFIRKRLSIDEIVARYNDLIFTLLQINRNIKIIFTVSPIRHWKDGAHGNTLSKSVLLLAIDELQQKFANILYFPAYEIVMDELRDYRFYAPDMLHLTDTATEYIFKRFTETFFDAKTREFLKKAEQLNADNQHIPINKQSFEYQIFIQQKEKRKNNFIADFPFLANKLHGS